VPVFDLVAMLNTSQVINGSSHACACMCTKTHVEVKAKCV